MFSKVHLMFSKEAAKCHCRMLQSLICKASMELWGNLCWLLQFNFPEAHMNGDQSSER